VNEPRRISAGTISRFVLLLLALINTGLNLFGVDTIPIDEEAVEEFISLAFIIVTSLWAYWKNNDVTKKARLREKQ
jgi:SPP1 family holin